MHPRTLIALCLSPLLLAGPASCTIGGSRSLSAENDRLRAESLEQKRTIDLLTRERDELRVKLLEEAKTREGAPQGEALLALPRCASIEIDPLSGYQPAKAPGVAPTISVYVRTLDARARFVPVAGSLVAEAIALPADVGKGDPAPVGSVMLPPLQVRDAYRSGFMGTCYEIQIPAPAGAELSRVSLVLRVELRDAITGSVLRADRTVKPARRGTP